MVKKISTVILAMGILVSGFFAQRKLNFRERSIAIFKLNTQEQQFTRGMGRGQGGFAGSEGFRPGQERISREGREVPDSIRMRFNSRGERPIFMEGSRPDSTVRRVEGRGFPGNGMRHGEGSGRGDSRVIKKINFRNIPWFLAIFASFTVIVIYVDKGIRLLRQRLNTKSGIIPDKKNCPDVKE